MNEEKQTIIPVTLVTMKRETQQGACPCGCCGLCCTPALIQDRQNAPNVAAARA